MAVLLAATYQAEPLPFFSAKASIKGPFISNLLLIVTLRSHIVHHKVNQSIYYLSMYFTKWLQRVRVQRDLRSSEDDGEVNSMCVGSEVRYRSSAEATVGPDHCWVTGLSRFSELTAEERF